MIDGISFETIEQFFAWWVEINPLDELDITEAMTIFFNLDNYEGAI